MGKCRTEINDTFIDEAEHINFAMPMYNLIEYNDNYSDTSGSLWRFQRDEIEGKVDLSVNAQHFANNSSSFKYKSSLITDRNDIRIAVPLKYLSNFRRSLEMLLIICKVELSLTWDRNCVLCTLAGNSDFAITDAKFYVPIVTLSTEDSAKLSNLLSKGFKRPVYWNAYKVITEKSYNANDPIRETIDSHRRCFLPRVEIKNYNIEIDGRNFCDQPINNQEIT